MKVNSPTKVTNLNADKLDGKEESAFLGKTETAANADTLDGHDSTEFLQGNDGDAITGAQAIPSGTNDRLVLQHSDHSPEISIFYFCPTNLSNNGTLRIRNNGEEPINVFSDNGDTTPNAYKQLSHTQGFDQQAAASGEHITLQVQGAGVGTIEVFSVHRTSSLGTGTENNCHVQAGGLFVYQ